MALDKETIEQIKGVLKKARAQAGRFLYCVSGEDGDPVLLLHPRKIPAQQRSHLKRTAQKKKFVRGSVRYDKDEQAYVFSCLAAPLPAFSRDLKRVFARQIPQLRGALVELAEMDEQQRDIEVLRDAQETASEAEGGLGDLRAERDQLNQILAQLEDQEKSARLAAEAELGWLASEEEVQKQEEAKKRLAKLTRRRLRTKAELIEARNRIEQAERASAEARAIADDLLSLWDLEQQRRWAARRDGDDPESAQWRAGILEQTASYAQAARAYDDATEKLAPLQQEYDDVSALAQDGYKDVEALEAERDNISAELDKLERKRPFTDADADRLSQLEMQQRGLGKRIQQLSAAIKAAQERAPDLEDEIFILGRKQERARVTRDIAEARQQMLISTDAESDLRQAMVMDMIDQSAELKAAREELEFTAHALADAERGTRRRSEADAALRAAQMSLHAIQIERKKVQELADSYSWGGLWEDAARIEAAQGQLPGLIEREKAALAAFRKAQAAASTARLADRTNTDDLVEARWDKLDAEVKVARIERDLSRTRREHADEDARLAAVSADLSRRACDERIAELTEASPALQAAEADLVDADASVFDAQAVLGDVDKEIAAAGELIEEIRWRLRQAASKGWRRREIQLLEDMREQLKLLAKLERGRDQARGVLEAALEMQAEAADKRDEQIQIAGAADPELGALLDAVDGASRLSAAAAKKAAEMQAAVEKADAALAELERREGVVERQAGLEELVDDPDTQALIAKFHHMEDAADIDAPVFVIDLLDGADREKAAEIEGYQDLLHLQRRLEGRAQAMLRAGATAEELDQAFARIPNGLRPPAYRAEVAAFVTLQEAFSLSDEEKVEQKVLREAREQVLVEEKKLAAMEKLRSLSADGDALSAARAALNDPAVEENPSLVDSVVSALGSIEHTLRTAEAGTVETMEDVHAALADSLLVLQKANLDVVALVGPALTQLLGPAEEAYQAVMEAAVHRGKARYTALLAKAAKVSGSPLAGAFEEAVAAENTLWARYSVEASLSAVQIVGRLVIQFPGTAAMGAALELGAYVGRAVSDAAFTLDGWRTAQKAKDLLDRAQAGSEEARAELFKVHPLYAKGLIAYMAQQDDPFARSYVALQAGDPDAADRKIKGESLRILTHYLLDSAEQLDPDGSVKLETAAEWCERQRVLLVDSISDGFKGVSAAVDRWREVERFDDGRLKEVQQTTHQLAESRKAAQRLLARNAKEGGGALQRQALEDLLERYRMALAAVRREAMAGLTRLELLERRAAALARHSQDADEDTKAAAQRLEAAVPDMRERYLDIVGVLAKAA